MKILGIDSSGLVASIAVVEDDQLLAEYTINYKKTHSQTLLPMLDEIARMIELDLTTLDAIAVSGGPGSFTGLRIGSATAKGLGLSLDKPLISVPTVDALAYQLWGSDALICPLMDARRGQVYTGLYTFQGEQLQAWLPQCALSLEELLEQVNACKMPVIFLGDGVPVYRKKIQALCEVPFSFAPACKNKQSAAALATLAMEYWKEGKIQSAAEHKPDYLRLSQAERERLERQE